MHSDTAVLIIDMQDEFLTRAGMFKRPVDGRALVGPLTMLLDAARHNHHTIVWITSQYPERAAFPEPLRPPRPPGPRYADVPMNTDRLASGHAGRPCCAPGSDTARMYAPVAALMQPDDLRVVKHRYSAFGETDLAQMLRERGVRRVAVCGVVANVCVRATAADAFFCGFEVDAIEDGIGATDSKRMREGLDVIEKHYGTIRSAVEMLGRWGFERRGLGAGDSGVLYGVLPNEIADGALAAVREEVDWQEMYHRGGLVPRQIAIQGTREGDREPLYRHPADEQPALVSWTPLVDRIRTVVAERLGQALNHALIQRYPDGSSNISLHADKTLDVARGSVIVNYSLGATRTMLLQSKTRGENGQFPSQRVELPHNSLFLLGWETNRTFKHGIRPDKRADIEKRRDELRYGGERISLTLRTIATFRTDDGAVVGQGARTGPPMAPEEERHALLIAFGTENRDPDFDWDAHYGQGFDRINFRDRRR
ncbi:MAG: isochorismatase family protein [Myxococcota bacterium]